MAEVRGMKPTTEDGNIDQEILGPGEGRKVFGVTLPPWRSPLAQGLWGDFRVAENSGELT